MYTKNKRHKYSNRNSPSCKYHDLNDFLFVNIDDEYKAYILGYIAADGNLSKSSNSITISSVDLDIITKIRNYICASLPIRQVKPKSISHSIIYTLEIHSYDMFTDIANHLKISPGKKCNLITIPNLNHKFKRDFIRGFFDGDGHVCGLQNKRYSSSSGITSSSRTILEQIVSYVKIPCNVRLHKAVNYPDKQYYCIEFSGMKCINFLDILYRNSKIFMDRKYKLYMVWKDIYNTQDNIKRYLLSIGN